MTTLRGRPGGRNTSSGGCTEWQSAMARWAGATLHTQGSTDPSAEVGRCAGGELEETRPWEPLRETPQDSREFFAPYSERVPHIPIPLAPVPLVDPFDRRVKD